MKVHDIKNEDGKLVAFEVGNVLIGRRMLCGLVKSIPGATVKRAPRFLSWLREEEFCEFEIEGQSIVVLEPFGDNSRYWVSTRPLCACPQIETVKSAFVLHKPFFGLFGG